MSRAFYFLEIFISFYLNYQTTRDKIESQAKQKIQNRKTICQLQFQKEKKKKS